MFTIFSGLFVSLGGAGTLTGFLGTASGRYWGCRIFIYIYIFISTLDQDLELTQENIQSKTTKDEVRRQPYLILSFVILNTYRNYLPNR